MLEETWGLAASMICKALFNREVPFNPEVIFRAVKTYTDVGQSQLDPHEEGERRGRGFLRGRGGRCDPEMAVGAQRRACGAERVTTGRVTLLSMMQDAVARCARPEFTEAQIIDEMKQYLWAGTETTALTLAWCFYLLYLHPDVADRIRREGEDTYGDRVPTWEDVHGLTFTRSVIQETMRLYPPIWSFIRQAVAEDEIGGHKVKPGDKMVMCAYIVHHHPKYWNDPEHFDPDRFSPENATKRAKYSYLPFGAGKRSCIGGALSLVENTLALTQLLRRFRPEYLGENSCRDQRDRDADAGKRAAAIPDSPAILMIE